MFSHMIYFPHSQNLINLQTSSFPRISFFFPRASEAIWHNKPLVTKAPSSKMALINFTSTLSPPSNCETIHALKLTPKKNITLLEHSNCDKPSTPNNSQATHGTLMNPKKVGRKSRNIAQLESKVVISRN